MERAPVARMSAAILGERPLPDVASLIRAAGLSSSGALVVAPEADDPLRRGGRQAVEMRERRVGARHRAPAGSGHDDAARAQRAEAGRLAQAQPATWLTAFPRRRAAADQRVAVHRRRADRSLDAAAVRKSHHLPPVNFPAPFHRPPSAPGLDMPRRSATSSAASIAAIS